MTQKEIARIIGKSEQTLINWRNKYPKLYEAVINYYNSNENNFNISNQEKELLEYFKQLSEEEKELYISEMKARILRKKLD